MIFSLDYQAEIYRCKQIVVEKLNEIMDDIDNKCNPEQPTGGGKKKPKSKKSKSKKSKSKKPKSKKSKKPSKKRV